MEPTNGMTRLRMKGPQVHPNRAIRPNPARPHTATLCEIYDNSRTRSDYIPWKDKLWKEGKNVISPFLIFLSWLNDFGWGKFGEKIEQKYPQSAYPIYSHLSIPDIEWKWWEVLAFSHSHVFRPCIQRRETFDSSMIRPSCAMNLFVKCLCIFHCDESRFQVRFKKIKNKNERNKKYIWSE